MKFGKDYFLRDWLTVGFNNIDPEHEKSGKDTFCFII